MTRNPRSPSCRCLPLVVLVCALLYAGRGWAEVDFDRDVRPILSDNCFKCHGPDEATRQADLRLDVRDGVFARAAGDAPIVPGDPEASDLYRRIIATDPEDRMPPPNSGLQLSPAQKDIIRRWIESGAPWQRHWAFEPVNRPAPPPESTGWSFNALDRFVHARLEAAGLAPSPEADRETLLRRVTLDLTGFPPTPRELDAYLADASDDAYARVVDRLLQSPRHGERMAIRWLDAARYADTNGYQTDGVRDMWRWRDWVIDAYNRNMPFDQFTIEQLAGDLLPDATVDQIVATGFNRNHRANSEGGIVPAEYLVEYAVDRVDTTATVWLGLTASCARCHDHKYDPISQEEFYGLISYFNNVPERGKVFKHGNTIPVIACPTDAGRDEAQRIRTALTAARQEVDELEEELRLTQRRWELAVRGVRGPAVPANYTVSRGLAFHAALDESVEVLPQAAAGTIRDGQATYVPGVFGSALDCDGNRFADLGDIGDLSFFDKFSMGAWVYWRGGDGGILSRMDDLLGRTGYCLEVVDGRVLAALSRRWLDDSLRVRTKDVLPTNGWHHVFVTYDGTRYPDGLRIYLDGKEQELIVDQDNMVQEMTVKQPFRVGSRGTVSRWDGWIDDVRLYEVCLEPNEVTILATPDSIDRILAVTSADRTAGQALKLRKYYIEHQADSQIRDAHRRLTDTRREYERVVESFPTVMVMQEMATPRPTHVLVRGEYDNPGKRVSRGVPAFLPGLDAGEGNDRLALARWIVDRSNPLTARVTVNRVWQMLFGVGLVESTEDFGVQGARPSHPHLLDWLAAEFMRDWNVKRLLRLIVSSATYRQSSRLTPRLAEVDPENRLLSRGARYRLSAEMIRDQALAVSGLLVEKIGGPSVRPYQPKGIWKDVVEGGQEYVQDTGDALYRRSMYTFWRRIVAPPGMITLDSATRESCQVRENRTNTPLQALHLLNDAMYIEAARMLGQRALLEISGSDTDRVRWMVRVTAARLPGETEEVILLDALKRHRDAFRLAEEAARELVAVGDSDAAPDVDMVELAAYTALANTIMNLDEVLTRE